MQITHTEGVKLNGVKSQFTRPVFQKVIQAAYSFLTMPMWPSIIPDVPAPDDAWCKINIPRPCCTTNVAYLGIISKFKYIQLWTGNFVPYICVQERFKPKMSSGLSHIICDCIHLKQVFISDYEHKLLERPITLSFCKDYLCNTLWKKSVGLNHFVRW